MKQMFRIVGCLLLMVSLTACGSEIKNQEPAYSVEPEEVETEKSEQPEESTESDESSDTDKQIRVTTQEGNAVVFQLNDSPASSSLYSQLPLSVEVNNYGENEKIFYPPRELDVKDTPMAEGPAGTLSYYEPMGNVAVYYGECGGAGGLYELGEAVSGMEYISELAGEIKIDKMGNQEMAVNTLVSDDIADWQVISGKKESHSHPSEEREEPIEEAEETSMEQAAIHAVAEEDSSVEKIQIAVGEQSFAVTLYDNEAAKSLAAKLPMTLDMSELHGNEKYFNLPEGLPTDSGVPEIIHAGDLMLFGSDCLVLFYEGFQTIFSYTPLGYVEDTEGLAEALGDGTVQVTFRAVEQ